MTTLASSEQTEKENKSPLSSPLKLRQLLSDVFTSDDAATRSAPVSNLISEATCEATNQEAFFNRVKSYTCLKWTGKPRVLSPLRCSQYGWINTDTDMLMCCSCQTYLCASVQPSHDFQKYKARVLEVKQQLRTQHKEFCSWADFPSPERFCVVPLNEPEELLSGFLERFKNVLLLQSHLPSIKAEQLKDMSLSRDVISTVLQLVDDVKIVPEESSSEVLNIQMTACILALCGWGASSSMNIPVLTCSYCMRKAGTWNFLTEAAFAEEDICLPLQTSSSVPEGKSSERVPPPSSPSHPASCRMKLRSQDPMRSEQLENTPPPPLGRTRSRDSPSPVEELPRAKRPLTRSRGHGDGLVTDMAFSPQKKNKRPRLSSCSGSEGLLHRDVFDPLGQHRHWCPWVTGIKDEAWSLEESAPADDPDPELHPAGWRASLHLLVQMKENHRPPGIGPEEALDDRSRRIFSIFSQ